MLDLFFVRAIFALVLAVSAYFLKPFNSQPLVAAGVGLVLGAAIILFEVRLEQVSLKRLIGAAFGSVLGIFGAFRLLVPKLAMLNSSSHERGSRSSMIAPDTQSREASTDHVAMPIAASPA